MWTMQARPEQQRPNIHRRSRSPPRGRHGRSRAWQTLGEAMGKDPQRSWVEEEVRTFDSYFLRERAPPQRATYTPRVYDTFSGVPYFRPDGWWQFRIKPWWFGGGAAVPFEEISSWPVAYHGTSCDNLGSILDEGLRKPGEVPWVRQAHGAAGAGPDGAIYVTPSLWYASHPVYSTLKRTGEDRWVQVALKIRVRPGMYRIQANTLGPRHWDPALQLDPNFPDNTSLEWLLEEQDSGSCNAVIVGLMLREIGGYSDQQTFGTCPLLGVGCSPQGAGPEYMWSDFLQRQFRYGGFTLHSHSPALMVGKLGFRQLRQPPEMQDLRIGPHFEALQKIIKKALELQEARKHQQEAQNQVELHLLRLLEHQQEVEEDEKEEEEEESEEEWEDWEATEEEKEWEDWEETAAEFQNVGNDKEGWHHWRWTNTNVW
eukprot:TRINITY_DN60965_c0_g1_i1.p1 TRINITY_DN60965_c0_g1~~TRINITY_DN60965_c0_g1_i1.p1  ORF type:complete len:428 (-),score=41.40 TRINITY_DN60965_c0_g1_i1:113-1396(-)